jgi:catechol 2,3-dioxygenase-like lactoylglutathione lyase family enzyme
MVRLPLAHVSWAIADNADRPACDAFFIDVFGAETVFEMLVTPETEKYRFDREERLMVVGDTMLLPIAPAGPGAEEGNPLGDMLRRTAGANKWIGVSLRVADLKAADAWFTARGFKLHYDRGMENHYFLISRRQALGVRIEIMTGELPNDPRLKPDWAPERWRDDHPLGIEGLQSIGVSTPSLDEARELLSGRLEWPELSQRTLPGKDAECAAFLMGDTVIEAMCPTRAEGALAEHVRDIQGIFCLTFKVRSAQAAADYLRGRGLSLIGDAATRFAIDPAEAHGRLIWFTDREVPGYPPVGSFLRQPAEFPG